MKILYFILLSLVGFYPVAAQNISPESAIPDHPRILMLKGEETLLNKQIAENESWSSIQKNVLMGADSILKQQPLKRILIGKRLLDTSRESLFRIFMLSYAFRTTNNEKYAKRAEKELLAVCNFTDWNPIHFLDIAEMTTAVSIGYDWLFDYLPQQSKDIIREAIINKGLMPSMNNEYNSWLTRDNNWNQVCNTAMAYGALAVWENNKPLASEILNRSVQSIKLPMAAYGPDGAYPEGYGYWNFGTSYNVLFLSAIEKIFGTDFELSKIQGFMQSPNYIINMIGQKEKPFNYGDSGGDLRLNVSLFWFADKLENPGLVRYELLQLQNKKNYFFHAENRFLPASIIWGAKMALKNVPLPIENMYVGRGETPVCLMRSSWDEEKGIYLGVKGGSPKSNTHNHLDEGSFVMDAMGLRWAMDFGPQSYNTIESKGIDLWDNSQKSPRWTIFRYNNFAHNVITVDNQLFDVTGKVEIVKSSNNPEFMFGVLNTTAMYAGRLKSAKRGLAIVDKKYVLIQDEVESSDKPVVIQWRMVTPAKATIIGNHIELEQKGKKMQLEVIANVPVKLKTWSTAPTTDYDAENPNTIIVGYEVQLPAHQKETLRVKLLPEKTNEEKTVLKPIDDWK
ncbi:MAG: heparinase II/III family protein [Paludibacter sp.]|nr:heparinase II/III family protein [Paludibacter sp.]